MTELPPAYRWIDEVRPLPRMVAAARRIYGTIETPGPADNPVILDWAREAGLSKAYSSDAVPWCGLFMALVARRAGKAAPLSLSGVSKVSRPARTCPPQNGSVPVMCKVSAPPTLASGPGDRAASVRSPSGSSSVGWRGRQPRRAACPPPA